MIVVQRLKKALEKTPILLRLARGSFWIFISTVVTRLLSLVSTILIARVLGKEQYGELSIYMSTMDLAGLVAGFGIGTTINKYVAEYKRKDPEKASRIIGFLLMVVAALGVTIASAMFVAAPWIAEVILKRGSEAGLLRAGSITLLLSPCCGVLSESLVGFEAFKKTAFINFWQGLILPTIVVSTVFLIGKYSVIVANIISGILGIVLGFIMLRRECRTFAIVPRFDRTVFAEWRILPKFSLPALMSGILVLPVMWMANLFLVNQENGYAELGRYTVANQWRMVFIVVQSILTPVMFPILSDVYSNQSHSAFKSAAMINVKLTWIISLPLSVLIVAFRKPIAFLYGSQYSGVEIIIALLAIVSFLSIVNATVGVVYVSAGKIWWGTLLNIIWGLVLLSSAYFLVPIFGALGLAGAFLISYALHSLFQFTVMEVFLLPKGISDEKSLVALTLCVLAAELWISSTNPPVAFSLIALGASLVPVTRVVLRSNLWNALWH
jgi:O-antigen/teichoic acid export membrane protein